jgi:hypothetical protein
VESDRDWLARLAEQSLQRRARWSRLEASLEPRHRFTIRERLGQGGYAEVYEICGPAGEAGALKLLYEALEPQRLARLERILDRLSRLRGSERFALPLDIGQTRDGRTYYTLPLYPSTLRDLLPSRLDAAKDEELAPEQRLDLLEQLASALALLHGEGIVHRDVKPGNVLVRPAADGLDLALSDFDFAHWPGVEADLTGRPAEGRADRPFGTVPYAPPEAWPPLGPVGPAWDVWSFGMTAHELLTGCYPLRCSIEGQGSEAVLEECRRVCRGEAPLHIQVPDGPFARLVAEALELDPRRRPTAAALASRLAAIRSHSAPGTGLRWTAAAPTPRIPGLRPRSRQRLVLGAVAVAVVLTGALGAALWNRPPVDPESLVRRAVRLSEKDVLMHVLSADLLGAGAAQAAALIQTETNAGHQSRALMVSSEGRLLWERHLGRKLRFAEGDYADTYVPSAVLGARLTSGQTGLAVHATHDRWWPSQVLILDPASGEVLAEYFHCGHGRLLVEDLDGDGADELLFGATNNSFRDTGPGRGAATLAVLEARPFRGRSPGVPEPFDPELGLQLGQERAYLRFPLSDLGSKRLMGRHGVHELEIQGAPGPGRRIVAGIREIAEPIGGGGATLHYTLDAASFEVRGVSASDHFLYAHGELLGADRLSATVDEAYLADLGSRVRYWHDGEWLTYRERVQRSKSRQ